MTESVDTLGTAATSRFPMETERCGMTQPGHPWMGTKGQEASYVWFGKLGRKYDPTRACGILFLRSTRAPSSTWPRRRRRSKGSNSYLLLCRWRCRKFLNHVSCEGVDVRRNRSPVQLQSGVGAHDSIRTSVVPVEVDTLPEGRGPFLTAVIADRLPPEDEAVRPGSCRPRTERPELHLSE
jgi:hypothetical protein